MFRIVIMFIFIFNSNNSYSKEYYKFTEDELRNKKIVIIGSYKKCYNEMLEALKYFNLHGGIVLAPIKSSIIDSNIDFVILKDDDKNKTPKELQDSVLEKIRQSDFIYVMNIRYCKNKDNELIDLKENWMGLSTSMEFGYALALNKPVICFHKPIVENHKFYCK